MQWVGPFSSFKDPGSAPLSVVAIWKAGRMCEALDMGLALQLTQRRPRDTTCSLQRDSSRESYRGRSGQSRDGLPVEDGDHVGGGGGGGTALSGAWWCLPLKHCLGYLVPILQIRRMSPREDPTQG